MSEIEEKDDSITIHDASTGNEENESSVTIHDAESDIEGKTKKSKKILIAAIIAGIAVVGVVVFLLRNSISRLFMSDEEYLTQVVTDDVSNVLQDVEDYTALMPDKVPDNIALEGSIILSDEISSSFTWLNSVDFTMDAKADENYWHGIFNLGLNGTKILKFEEQMDFTDGTIWASFPELSKKYLRINGDEQTAEFGEYMSSLYGDEGKLEEVKNAYKIKNMYEKYLETAFAQIHDVEKESGSLEVGSIKQKCDIYTIKIDKKLEDEEIAALWDLFEKDEEFAEFFANYYDYVLGALYPGVTGSQLYFALWGNFQECAYDAKERLKEDVYDSTIDATLQIYVKNNTVYGYQLTSSDDEVVSYFKPEKGKLQGIKLLFDAAGESFVFAGEGQKKDDKLTGDYTIELDGKKMLDIKCDNLSLNPEGSDDISTIDICVCDGFPVEDLVSNSMIRGLVMNADLKLEFSGNREKSDIKLTLLEAGKKYIEAKLSTHPVDEITYTNLILKTPPFEECIDLESENGMCDFMIHLTQGGNNNLIYNTLVSAGVPKLYCDDIDTILSQYVGLVPSDVDPEEYIEDSFIQNRKLRAELNSGEEDQQSEPSTGDTSESDEVFEDGQIKAFDFAE